MDRDRRKSGMIEDLVERLRMTDATMKPMTLVIVAHEAANFIEKQAKYIEAYQNQTNILLRSVEMLEAKLAEKEND
jgi:hypothetical protein